jgi:hypothetical protein
VGGELELAYEKSKVRSTVHFAVEASMFMAQQKEAIPQYADWIKANGSRFQLGKWYFAGKLMTSS